MKIPDQLSPEHRQLADLKRAIDAAAIVATTDVDGLITYANDKFCEVSGYSREELLGQDHRIINSGYHSKAFMRDMWTTIAGGRVWHGEIRNRTKRGDHRWFDTTIVPFLDERGKPYQYVAIRVEVTARKLAEEKLAQQAAYERLAELAAVVAHEVRNSLAGVKGAMQVLLSRHATDADLPLIRDVIARVDSSSELIDDLMTFARPRQPRLSDVRLRALVHEALASVRRDAGGSSIEVGVHGDEIAVAADADLVRATLINLLRNAIQAIQSTAADGRVEVTVGVHDGTASVEVRDSGPGISPEIRDRVLEPFFTTKTRGGGLGLPIARRTADVHGGSLDLDFPSGGGTRVTLRLPTKVQEV